MKKPAKPRPQPVPPALQAAGEALWGPHYRSELARQLGVHIRTSMRWDRGESAVPHDTWVVLGDLLKERQKEIDKVIVSVDRMVEKTKEEE